MAQQPDTPTDVLETEDLGRPDLVLARLISQIFHPVFVAVACYLIVSYYTPLPIGTSLMWALIVIGLQIMPSMIIYIIRRRHGAYSDSDVSVRHERNEMYGYGSVAVLAAIAVLMLLGVPRPFLALAIAILAMGVVCGVVNLFWKISMHATAVGSLAMVALIYSRDLGIVLWLCALAVGWARVRTRNHTPLQVLAGLCVAATLMLVSFSLIAPQ